MIYPWHDQNTDYSNFLFFLWRECVEMCGAFQFNPLRLDLQLVVPELDEEHMQDTLAHHGQTKQLFAANYG